MYIYIYVKSSEKDRTVYYHHFSRLLLFVFIGTTIYICKYCTITIGLIAFVCRFVPNHVSPHCNAACRAGGRPSLFSLGCRPDMRG